ncbi:hypothetical protein C0992_007640 [Termitomyces sp. T32_za158]|nr:hypothetical protein C0992_007640 [Termitomyces sp. T32_za158]
MQEACEAFRTAVYNTRMGVQTFYDDLVGHAQNMAVYPDEFTIRETFLDRIPAEMHCTLIRNDNLSPEVNTVTEFLAYAIRYEQSAWTATHYDQHSSCRATGQRQPVKVGTFLAKHSEMECNHNPWFAVRRSMPAGHKPGLEQAGDAGCTTKSGAPKATFGGRDAGYKPSGGTPPCYNCGRTGRFSKECKVPRAQVRAAHTAAVESDAENDDEAGPDEPAQGDQEGLQDVEEQSVVDDAKSIHINGDEYVAVDVYDNNYYTCDDEEEHMFALTEHQGDGRIHMRRMTLQKAVSGPADLGGFFQSKALQ